MYYVIVQIVFKKRGSELNDNEVISLMKIKKIPLYAVENTVGDHVRGVKLRRRFAEESAQNSSQLYLCYKDFDWKKASVSITF